MGYLRPCYSNGQPSSWVEPFVDFPFERPEHRSAAIAGILSPLARHAYPGPTPLFFIDANVRGAGKGLVNDVQATIATGRPLPRATFSGDDAEMRKCITTFALAGYPAVLLDNVADVFGTPALDAALTATSWQDRI